MITMSIKQNSLTCVVPTRLTINDYELLLDVAKQQKITISALLRKLAIKYIYLQHKEIPALNN